MRAGVVVVVVMVAGCHASPIKDKATPRNQVQSRLVAPAVTSADVLARTSGAPPVIITVASTGTFAILAGPPTWSALATVDVSTARPIDWLKLDSLMTAARAAEWSPKETLAHASDREFERPVGEDDPPPPEEEPPDDSDESGGTGTAMALPPRTKDSRTEHVDAAGGFGRHIAFPMRHAGWGTIGTLDPTPWRAASIVGEVVEDRMLSATTRALVVADPRAPAKALMLGIAAGHGALGVAHDGAITALRTQFVDEPTTEMEDPPWIELRMLAPDRFELEVVPNKPVTASGSLKEQLALLRAEHALDPWNPIDVLVAPGITAQQLVDVIVALDQAGAHAIGLGDLPGAKEMALRGKPLRQFWVDVGLIGDLDREPVRRALKDKAALRACYETALIAKPDLEGTLVGTFDIGPRGEVVAPKASGVDDGFARCIVDVFGTMSFGKPTGRGRVETKVTIRVLPNWRPRARY